MKKKTVVALLSVLLAASVSYADESARFVTYLQFDGGLNSQATPYVIQDSQAVDAQNVRFNDSYGGLSKRDVNILYGSAGSHTIEGMHRYYASTGLKKLIVAGSTKLYVGDDDAGTFQVIGKSYTDSRRWTFTTYKDIAIGSNGYEQPIKYDGHTQVTANTDGSRTEENVVAELGAPFAELNTGSNLDASSWYQYKVAFYDGANYTYSTARSNPIQTGAAVMDVTLTDIPLGPVGTTTRYIYRTDGNADRTSVLADTTYNLIGTISDNTTTTLDDTTADGSTDSPDWATVSAGVDVTPPMGKYLLIHDERLFVAGSSNYPSDIYWSDEFNPQYFDPTDYEQVRPDDGDAITFIREFLGILTIGKTNTIQKLYTDSAEGSWTISDPFSFVGCTAPYSVANTPLGIFYLNWSGIYRFSGQKSELISDAITADVNDVLPSSIGKAAGYYYGNEYHLAYTSRESGSVINNRVLVYDVVRNAYAKDTKYINSFEAFDSGDDFGVLYHGSSQQDGKVYADYGAPDVLSKRFKSEIDAGTFDDTRTAGPAQSGSPIPIGTEFNFWIELAWDITIDEALGTIDTHSYGASATIDRPDGDGTWISPVYNINAGSLTQVQWNESLTDYGDVKFYVRTGSSEAACLVAAWSSAFTDPTGSDLTGVTANDYVQIKIELTTTDTQYTPTVFTSDGYLFRMFYLESGDTYEPSVVSVYKSGWRHFGNSGLGKFIRRIKVFYEGSSGSFDVTYENNEGDVSRSFTVDMTQDPDEFPQDYYKGSGDEKYYEHFPSINTSSDPAPVGNFWRFTITHTDTTEFKINGIEVEFFAEEPLP